MAAYEILRSLIRNIGPVNTFLIKQNIGAYSELSITKNGHLTNRQLFKIFLSKKDLAKAKIMAEKEGRIECPILGKIHEDAAGHLLMAIVKKSYYRSKHRKEIAKAVSQYSSLLDLNYFIEEKKKLALPDPKAPDTLGWRVWHWDQHLKKLKSPSQKTVWETPELRVEKWSTSDAVRGVAGIHAARMPYDWKNASLQGTELEFLAYGGNIAIRGVVERFGKYVLGTEGWRAEWVIIRKLKAPSTEIGLQLEQAYPEVEVSYENR